MAHTGSSSTEASSTEASSPSASNNNNHSNHNHQNSNSISYLAPFVASVLRDQVLTDSIAELKREREDRLRIELTGRNGTPVYCKVSMKDGYAYTSSDGTPLWLVKFDTIIPNFVETVAGLELRLGDIVNFKFQTATFCTAPAEHAGFDRTRDDTRQMGYICFYNDNGAEVLGRVGPILYEDYINLSTQTSVPGLVQFLEDYRTNFPNEPMLLSQLKIERVSFLKAQIPGVLSLLEDTTGGLSTSE